MHGWPARRARGLLAFAACVVRAYSTTDMSRRTYTPAMPSAGARLLIAGTSHIGLLFGALALTQFWLLNAVTAEGSQPMLSILVRGCLPICRCTMYPPIPCVM